MMLTLREFVISGFALAARPVSAETIHTDTDVWMPVQSRFWPTTSAYPLTWRRRV